MNITVYCDGSYDKDSGFAGLGIVLQQGGSTEDFSFPLDTPFSDNNQVEVKAIEKSIELVTAYANSTWGSIANVNLTIITDSDYASDCFTKAGFCFAKEMPYGTTQLIVNTKLMLEKFKNFTIVVVKSHTKIKSPEAMLNEHCDKLAKRALQTVLDKSRLGDHQFYIEGDKRFHEKCGSRVYGDDQGNRFCMDKECWNSYHSIMPMEDLVVEQI